MLETCFSGCLTFYGPLSVRPAVGLERTLAWLNRCRRLAKDFENLTRNGLAFLRLASIRLMLRKLCSHK